MDLYQLEYFLEAARQRSFTRAAAKLNLAQAALSEQMRKLEAELGARLFNRGRRETTLTPAGETLRTHAEALLAQAQATRRAVGDQVAMKGGRLAVGAIPSVSACLLPAAIAAFRRKHPQVELALLEGTSEVVAQWVEAGRIELGVVQLPASGDAFQVTPLLDESFVLLVPRKHPLARRRLPKLAELRRRRSSFTRAGRAMSPRRPAARPGSNRGRPARVANLRRSVPWWRRISVSRCFRNLPRAVPCRVARWSGWAAPPSVVRWPCCSAKVRSFPPLPSRSAGC